MPSCYICLKNSISVKALILHYKLFHDFESDGIFRCIENNCTRDFDNVYVFTRHLRNKHGDDRIHAQAKKHTDIKKSSSQLESQSDQLNIDNNDYAVKDNPNTFEYENHLVDLPKYTTRIEGQVLSCICKLYANRRMPRNMIQYVIEEIITLFHDSFSTLLRNQVLTSLKSLGESELNIANIQSMFDTFGNSFRKFSTEHLRMKFFVQTGCFIQTEDVIIGQELKNTNVNNQVVVQTSNVIIKLIPLRKVLKAFFELPNVLPKTLEYVDSLSSNDDILQNFTQGRLWKSKTVLYPNKTVLPLFIYFDEYEINNPLGSRAGLKKLGAVYSTVPCLPPQHQSKLENIFLTLLFHAEDRIKYGNAVTFRELFKEVNYLQENGIWIETPNGSHQIYFALGLVLGDNLGMNSILGFVESFSAKYSCRHCSVAKENLSQHSITELPQLLRTKDSYHTDLDCDDLTKTGIKEECAWHKVKNFHVVENSSVDCMHDGPEGVCRFDMQLVLLSLIDSKLFTLDTLNFRIRNFNYGPIEKRNKPPIIKNLDNIKMSASEMLCFVRHLSLIIGDLVPEDNPFWKLYLILRDLLDLISAPFLQKECSGLLKVLIAEHNELYLELSGRTLRPKNHFLVHYPRILKDSGPLVHFWSMRFEATHRKGKVTANATSSRVNIIETITFREQLQLCVRLLSRRGFHNEFSMGPDTNKKKTNVESLDALSSLIPNTFRGNCTYPKWVTVYGTMYSVGTALFIDSIPTIGLIHRILVNEYKCVCFVLCKCSSVLYSKHFHAYEVVKGDELTCVTLEQLEYPMPTFIVPTVNGKSYISPRYAL